MGNLFVELLDVVEQTSHAVRCIGRRDLQVAGNLPEATFQSLHVAQRMAAGDRLNPANARSDSAFTDDLEEADVARTRNVRAAAQLFAGSNGQHAHGVAVLFAEEHHGSALLRGFQLHDGSVGCGIGKNLGVHQAFDLGHLRRRHAHAVCEVEARALRTDQGTFLLNVASQHFAQRFVHQMGGAVVAHDVLAPLCIHLGNQGIAHAQFALQHRAVVAKHIGLNLQGVVHGNAAGGVPKFTGVAHLAATFGVEGGVIEHDDGIYASRHAVNWASIYIERRDLAVLAHQVFIAVEGGGRSGVAQALRHLELAGFACALLLLFQQHIEAGFVDADAALPADVAGEVHGEAVGVMQFEGGVAVHALAGGQGAFQDFHAVGNGAEEALFFLLQHFRHASLGLAQLRVGLAHLLDQGGNQLVEEGRAGAELVAVPDGAPGNAAQHVAAPCVARNDAVAHRETAGANVVGNDLEARAAGVAVARTSGIHSLLGGGQQGGEQVNFVVAVHMLQHGGQAFQAHAGVDAGLGQLVHHTVFGAVELHEDVVPDLDVAVAVLLRRAGRAAGHVGTVVVKDLGAGAAGAGVAHHPEVVGHVAAALVVADAHDALGGQADVLQPNVVSLVVFGVHRGPELVGRQLEVDGEQFPGVGDGVLLEVVAEAEVAQHFEEGVVACGVADVVQVVVLAAGADALLAGGGAAVGALVKAQEHVLELVHACVGEQQGRVVARHHGRAGHDGVAFGLEVLQEGGADLGGFHGRLWLSGCDGAAARVRLCSCNQEFSRCKTSPACRQPSMMPACCE